MDHQRYQLELDYAESDLCIKRYAAFARNCYQVAWSTYFIQRSINK